MTSFLMTTALFIVWSTLTYVFSKQEYVDFYIALISSTGTIILFLALWLGIETYITQL